MLLADIDDAPRTEHSAAHMNTRNIDTVRQAVESLATRSRWTAADIDELHRTLLPAHPEGFRNSGSVSALTAFRYDPRRGETADEAREAFVSFFLQATSDAVVVASDLLEEVRRVEASWAERTAHVRAHSAQHRLLALLADRPVLTIRYALDQAQYKDSRGTVRTYSRAAISKAFAELEAKGIVDRMPSRDGRHLVYRARELLDLLLLTERRLGSAELDTVAAPLSKRFRGRTPELPTHLRRST
ncbi:MarR family transcriptional regulator [Arsenicicoccus dermatophilus]|uniref:MarR family transcriptional regulator n=1 Tax=Arsenicicoccus dermatophilus TaxID=1076331 RepID=UPI003916EABB